MFTLAGDGVATGVTGVDVADGWGHFGVGGDLHSEKDQKHCRDCLKLLS